MYYIEADGTREPAVKTRRSVKGVEFTTWGRDVTNCNIFEVEAGTTGYQGGDTGHGGRTYFRLEDAWGTDISINIIKNGTRAQGVEIVLGGDTELSTFIEALKWTVSVLEVQSVE